MPQRIRAIAVLATVIALLAGCTGNESGVLADRMQTSPADGTRLTITDGRDDVVATLNTSATARDFASLLPVTIDVETYSDSAKIGYPERKLTTDGAPAGFDAETADFVYYAPYGDIAMFYDDSLRYDEGLIPLGRITEGLDVLEELAGPVRFDVAAPN